MPMITEQTFPVEPWQVRETRLDLNLLAQTESVFALSNGHIGLRGNLDEGEPYGLPGTYLNSFYETRPLPYAEAGYSYPEDGQSVVDVTNGKILRLLVEDEPFDVRTIRAAVPVAGHQAGHLVELTIRHAGERLELHTDSPTTVALERRKPLLPTPLQPPGREPIRRPSLDRAFG
jgi:trehalose/maltose hydrolase-like predicted phosphorylase